VWVTSEEGGTVFRIEPRSGEVEKVIGVGHGPVAIAAGEEAVWVVNRQDSTVWRIDPASDVVTDVRTVGRDPSAIAVDPDGVWVANRGDATLTRIDPATRRPAKTISVKGSPSAIAASDGSVWTAALAPPASHRGGKLRVEVGFLLDGKTPEDDTNGPTSLAYDGLLAYRRTGGPTFGTLVGNLATNVPEPSPDGKTYVFRLRRNIRYSNGEPVRPRDFRAAMESHFRFSPDGPFPDPALRIKGVPECLKTPARCDLSRGITSDPRAGTITLHLTEPDPDLLDYLTYPFAYLVPADHPFGHRRLPPGTGPYRVVSYDAKRGARLVRNPYFRVWSSDARPAGFADEIDVRLDADIRKQVAAVERGRADVVVVYSVFGGPLAPAGVRALATRDAGHLYTDASPETDFMFLNVRTPPFDDVRVRRALNYAVDRGALARLAGGPGLAQPTCQLVPPGFAGYVPSCRYTLAPGPAGAWTAPDTDAARRLIRESGTRGMHVTVWGYEEKRPIIRYFAALLHRLGYRSAVRIFPDYGAYRGPAARHAQIGIEGWAADVGAPGNFTPEFLCSAGPLNESHFCNRGIEARIDAARAARGRRALALWSDVYRRLSDAAPAVPFVNHRTVSLVSDRVGNFQRNPMWGALLDQLWVR
jgi:peptide/nickel transport system substrate-binding protein